MRDFEAFLPKKWVFDGKSPITFDRRVKFE